MASIVQDSKSSRWYIQIIFHEKRIKMYGFQSRREAEIVGERLEELIMIPFWISIFLSAVGATHHGSRIFCEN